MEIVNFSYEKITDNSYFAKFSYQDREYKTILYLEDDDWCKPVLLGCDQFKKIVSYSNGAENKLIQKLMNVKDPESAFLIIQRFIHRFSEKLETKSMKNELNLLEEIREIGFDKILDTNDEFTRFKLKLTNENVTISLRIFKAHLEYSLDSFKDFPIKTIYDVKKGFLLKVMKSALNDYKEIEKVSKEIFLKLDENFLTLKPERFDKETLKRRIQCGQCGQFGNEEKVIIIYYDYETKNIILRDYETKYSLEQSELLFTHLKEIILTTTTQSDNNSKKECGICYSNYLDGNLTDFICPNTENCKQVYHVSCLREWFRANPESRTIFDKICGTCLFCDKEILLNNN